MSENGMNVLKDNGDKVCFWMDSKDGGSMSCSHSEELTYGDHVRIIDDTIISFNPDEITINNTPHYYINGKELTCDQAYDWFQAAIDEKAEREAAKEKLDREKSAKAKFNPPSNWCGEIPVE